MTTLRIVFECDDTPNNRRPAALLFDNVRERMANPDLATVTGG